MVVVASVVPVLSAPDDVLLVQPPFDAVFVTSIQFANGPANSSSGATDAAVIVTGTFTELLVAALATPKGSNSAAAMNHCKIVTTISYCTAMSETFCVEPPSPLTPSPSGLMIIWLPESAKVPPSS